MHILPHNGDIQMNQNLSNVVETIIYENVIKYIILYDPIRVNRLKQNRIKTNIHEPIKNKCKK